MGVLTPYYCQLTGRWQVPSITAGAVCEDVPSSTSGTGSEPVWPVFSHEFDAGTYTVDDLLAISGGLSIHSLDIDIRDGSGQLTLGNSTSDLFAGGSFSTEARPGYRIADWTFSLDGRAKISWSESV